MKPIIRTSIIIISLCFSFFGRTQTQDSTYYSIQAALLNPLSVKKLTLDNVTANLETLIQFKNLESLTLINYKTNYPPKEVAAVTWLKRLEIERSNFVELPVTYNKLVKLEGLSIIDDSLMDVSNALAVFSKPTNFKEIVFNNVYPMTSFPEELFKYKNLEKLSLRGDHITTLPNNINYFDKLKFLDLGDNEIVQLPSSLINLSSIETLFIDHDLKLDVPQVKSVLIQMPALKELHLEGAGLTPNQLDITEFKQLEKLYIKENRNSNNEKEVDLKINNLTFEKKIDPSTGLIDIK